MPHGSRDVPGTPGDFAAFPAGDSSTRIYARCPPLPLPEDLSNGLTTRIQWFAAEQNGAVDKTNPA